MLSVEGLRIHFRTIQGDLHAVSNASFEINKAETYGIVGESGSGKTVTALSILRLLPPSAQIISGCIMFKGQNLLELNDKEIRRLRGKEIAMVFQDPQTSFDPVFTLANQIGEAIKIHQRLPKDKIVQHIVQLLCNVGIPNPEVRKDQYPHQFSGGMKQRAMSAMALSNNPDLVIADEPTTSLDVTIQAQIIDLLRTLKKDLGVAVLLITHDMGLVAELCDRISVMYAGYVVETADADSLFKNPRHPYTRALMESIPRIDFDKEELESIPGRVPNPVDLPPYCVFQPRCRHAKEICLSGMPKLLDVQRGAKVACFRAQRGEL